MPSPRYQHGFANDAFISYTHVDDETEAGIQWVSKFDLDLRTRLAKVSGRSVQIWRDNKLGGADRFSPEIKQQLADSAVLVTILTPSYLESKWCGDERESFIATAKAGRGLDTGNKSRIAKVVKTRVDRDRYPDDLRELLEFRFFVEEPNGRAREFHLSPDPNVQRLYDAAVDDVAQEIALILDALEAGAQPASKGSVYLAETTSDLEPQRALLRRSLNQRGYSVLPRVPLQLRSGPEVERLVKEDLAACKLAVHPVGAYYGLIPEQGGDRSIVELQLETVASANSNGSVARMVWIPSGLQPSENRQTALLKRIREDWPGKGFEVIERPLSDVETHIKDRLEPPVPIAAAPAKSNDSDDDAKAQIYLMCLPGADREAARAVRTYLFDRGYEVKLAPAGDGVGPGHAQRLETDDAFLLYYGAADAVWVEQMLSEMKRAKGLRKGAPILARGVYLAEPKTEDKQDFMTRGAVVLRAFDVASPEQALGPFIAEIDKAKAGAAKE